MNNSIAYSYDPETLKYVGEYKCQIDPLSSKIEGKTVYLLPANATWIEQDLEKKDGFSIVWNEDEEIWEYVENPPEEDDSQSLNDGKPMTESELFDQLRSIRNSKLLYQYDQKISQLTRNLNLAVEEEEKQSIQEKINEWYIYADELCKLPEQAGAPWDGGGELTPWPKEPE